MKLNWSWEIDEDGELSFEINQKGQDEPILQFSLDSKTLLEELEIDVQRSHYEDGDVLSEWDDLLVTLKALVVGMEERLK